MLEGKTQQQCAEPCARNGQRREAPKCPSTTEQVNSGKHLPKTLCSNEKDELLLPATWRAHRHNVSKAQEKVPPVIPFSEVPDRPKQSALPLGTGRKRGWKGERSGSPGGCDVLNSRQSHGLFALLNWLGCVLMICALFRLCVTSQETHSLRKRKPLIGGEEVETGERQPFGVPL